MCSVLEVEIEMAARGRKKRVHTESVEETEHGPDHSAIVRIIGYEEKPKRAA